MPVYMGVKCVSQPEAIREMRNITDPVLKIIFKLKGL
jgi:hypothetical protein